MTVSSFVAQFMYQRVILLGEAESGSPQAFMVSMSGHS